MKKKRNPFVNRCTVTENVWHGLRQWYRSHLGRRVEQQEKALLDELLSDLFGYYLLHVGNSEQMAYLRNSRVRHRMVMDICGGASQDENEYFCGEPHAIPVRSDSIDVMVLPHILEFSDYPHEVLREVDRTLVPEGHVVILGFNPNSLWNLWRWGAGWRGNMPWCGHFIRVSRIRDWLSLLGFDVVATRYYFYRPPVQGEGILRRLRFIERIGRRVWPILGGGYVLVARKEVITLTPIRPRWEPKRKIVAAGLAEPMSPPRKTISE
ncbi:MAG: class I SAM-dependent methyltransferase [Proteobacteria bacterium]|jgi:SAM-dependent methyltransferase|nr:class I SAM-dependent methyltransferase [Pseudomonadota bacterium]MCG6935902.1 class I SAM-dependent methyltransferase [Pseudomonadota bacterium]